jgi:hypothetical protein
LGIDPFRLGVRNIESKERHRQSATTGSCQQISL